MYRGKILLRGARMALLVGAVAIAGCTTIPLVHPDLATLMVHQVQCELKDARATYLADNSWLDTWAAAFTLTMKAEQQASAAPEVSLLGPFGSGTFSVPIGAGISSDAMRTATSKYTLRFDHLKLVDCSAPQDVAVIGTLGIKEWMGEVVRRNHTDAYRIPDTIGHSMQFTLSASGHVNPSFVLTRTSGTGLFSAQRSDTDILDIAMTDATPAPPQHVIVDNPASERLPGGRLSTSMARSAPQRVSPLVVHERVVNRGSTIPGDARVRLDNQLYELQLSDLRRVLR